MRTYIYRAAILAALFLLFGCRSHDNNAASGRTLVSISVAPANGANGSINNGYSQQFIATGTYSDGTTSDISSHVTWTSSDPAKATVDSTGLASSIAQGTTTIKATSGTVSGTSLLTVNPAFDASAEVSICTDTDGDGLCDTWEENGSIDLNGNGIAESFEQILTNVDPFFPDGTANPHPSADPNVKDIFVQYDFMVLPDAGNACVAAPISGAPYNSPDCQIDEYCVGGVCKGHSDAPDPAALKMVIDAFALKNIRLHIVAGNPSGLQHSRVLTFGPPLDICSADSASLAGVRRAIDFYDIKTANFDLNRKPAFHYVVLGHFHTCDSVADCAQPECANPDTGRMPLFGETGLAEIGGNDFINSMGRLRDRGFPPIVMNQAGNFMHEFGHNLGLNHGGPFAVASTEQSNMNYKPNYLSVMNYMFQAVGIETATQLGGLVTASTRIDYSGSVLPTLEESNLNEPAGIGTGNNDISYTFCPAKTKVPGTGPVDWNCNGDATETGLVAEINNDPTTDVMIGHSDWDQLIFRFQSTPGTFNDGAVIDEQQTNSMVSRSMQASKPRFRGRFTSQELTADEMIDKHMLYPIKTVQISLYTKDRAGLLSKTKKGEISVTLFGAKDLDVSEVDRASLAFAGAAPIRIETVDVNDDGMQDLVLTFDSAGLRLTSKTKKATLSGWLKNSQAFSGEAEVEIAK